MKNAIYDTSLTDAQWGYLYPMLPKLSKRGHPPTDRRRILDTILYVVKCGIPWRYLPADFPPWKTAEAWVFIALVRIQLRRLA